MDDAEKRKSKRCENLTPVRISLLNQGDEWDAVILNHCTEGMCFRSTTPFSHRVGLRIRVDGSAWGDISPEAYDTLRHLSIGEVKWCREIAEDTGHFFMTGVKYVMPVY